jgi:hypothetical protein
MRVALALLVVLVPAVAAAQPSSSTASPPSTSAHDTGPLLELRYTTGSSAQLINFQFSDSPPDPRSALFAGYQLARLSFGVAFELGRQVQETDSGGSTSGQAVTTYLLLPGLRAAIGRSSDGRAEVIGLADIGWGETKFTSQDGFSEPVILDRFRFQVGPGLRYWLGPSVAAGAAVLVRHDRIHNGNDQQGFTEDATRTDLAISLSATGVF